MKYVLIDGREFVDKEEFKKKLDDKLVELEISSPEYVRKCREIVKES